MELFTIGFTKKSAEAFFRLLTDHHIDTVVDVRLNVDGQLAGFAKRNDLTYFLSRLSDCGYVHLPELAPNGGILGDYRRDHDWNRYVARSEALMDERDIPRTLDRSLFEQNVCCLLCSEPTPAQCHRRLVAERLAAAWENTHIVHIV